MKKIMQINITCGRGSTGKLAQSLYHAVQQEGWQARFAYSAYTPTLNNAFPIETKWQNYLRRGLNRYFGKKQSHSTPGTKRLIRYIKKEQPDLIHLHNVQQNSVNYHKLFAFLKKSKIPVVYTLHDCWAFTGGCFHFTERNCSGFMTGCRDCPLSAHPDDVTLSAESAYACKKILIGENERIYPVCVSDWLRDSAASSYMKYMQHKPITVYNGIDTQLFCPKPTNIRKKYKIPEDRFMILGVASFWTEEKGLSIFLDLGKRLPEDAVIVLVGRQLEAMQETNIICIPQTENQEELAQIYSTADVYVNGSLEETFGMTTAEALACGTPAIVFDSTACPEVVDEKTGIVAQPGQKLLPIILAVKEKGKEQYISHCVKRVKACFSEERMMEEYLALYRSILDGK